MLLLFALRGAWGADARQLELLGINCIQCHAREDTGAPRMGYAEDWRDAWSRGEDGMLINVVNGIGGMPPLGYCSACSEEDLRVLIRLMAGSPETVE
jgi:cytochrome c5